ncbi:hypothetical protein DAEQUDRAFT_768195 [Daedalea quercina L-15889]|uniref:Uncharacterized protein n=1 Tax=Daedalea quercina L-15889 TaxID=1314783 RepID=A0A165MY63_9APHY|nr:hypothetical protein DAEQUDRAFT_768195 [Daedalea quercina L-15889]
MSTLSLNNSELLDRYKPAIRDDSEWHEAIAHENSDFKLDVISGHPGRAHTLGFIQHDYSWPGMNTLPALDDLFWNDDLCLFEIKSNNDTPTWNYLNNKLKASQSLTKKFLDSRRRISECIQEIHEQRPVKDTPATIQRVALQSQPTTPITSRVTSTEPTQTIAGLSRLTSPLVESDNPATTGNKSKQTNEPELIAEASALESESESDSDSDSDDEMTTIAELQAQINRLSGSTKLDVLKPKGVQGKSDDVGLFIQRINYAVLLIDSDSDANYWKDLHYLEEDAVQAQGQHRFDTWEEFKDAFRKAFPIYAEGDKALMTLTGRKP